MSVVVDRSLLRYLVPVRGYDWLVGVGCGWCKSAIGEGAISVADGI